jgi:hypothetical protein
MTSTVARAVAMSLPIRAIGKEGADRKPNIIFIMVDDMGYHDLGCFGSKTIKTPRIEPRPLDHAESKFVSVSKTKKERE